MLKSKKCNFSTLVLFVCSICLYNCKENTSTPKDLVFEPIENELSYKGIKVKLLSKCGEAFEGANFLPLPLNHGFVVNEKMDSLDILILGKPVVDTFTYVLPLAYFELLEGGIKRPFVLTYPEDINLQSMEVESYSSFMRKYYPVKVIIDTWFANYKGLASIRVTNWKDNFFAENLLEQNKYWSN